MIGAFAQFRGDRKRPISIRGVLLGWLVAELLAFIVAVKLLGLGTTLLVMIATSIIGASVLRRLGLGAVQHLRGAMGGREGLLLDGTLTALGALLLILPGFASDAVGLALISPSIRQSLAARFLPKVATATVRPASRNVRTDVIDLAPEDWRVVDKTSSR